MSFWTKNDRFEAVLNGELADRTPVAAWGHFVPHELLPQALAEITTDFTTTYDWDWIKLNPRSSYYGEAWGTHYDHSDVDVFQPRAIDSLISEPVHVWRIHRESGIRSKALADQVLATELVHKALPDVPLAQTVFNPLTALLEIAAQPVDTAERVPGSRSRATLERLLNDEPEGVRHALDEISAAFLTYFERLKNAGASALFYAITPATNNPILNRALIGEFSDRWDRQLIGAAKDLGFKVIYHTCGEDTVPQRLVSLGADGLSWDSSSPLNPAIADVAGIVPVGGVDRLAIDSHDVDAVQAQAGDTERALAGRPHLLAPTCAVTTGFDNPALFALHAAVAPDEALARKASADATVHTPAPAGV